VKVIENISEKKWLEILEEKKEYSFFQTPDFSSIICKHIKNYEEAHKLFVFDNGSEVLLPLIKIKHLSVKLGKCSKEVAYNLASLPLGANGGLISANPISDEQLKEISNYLISINKMGILIINHPQSNVLFSNEFKIYEHKTLVIPLNYTYEDIWNNRFNSKIRAEIRKAQKEGVVVKEIKDDEIIKKYLLLSDESMKSWAKKDRLPIGMIRDLIYNQNSRLWVAMIKDELIAGVLMLCSPNEMYYYQSAMNKYYSRFYPTKYIFELVIKYGIENGYKMINLGGSGGIRNVEHFKMSFNPETMNYKIQLFASKFWDKMRKLKNYLKK